MGKEGKLDDGTTYAKAPPADYSSRAMLPPPESSVAPGLTMQSISIPFASPQPDGSIYCEICGIYLHNANLFEVSCPNEPHHNTLTQVLSLHYILQAHVQGSQHWASVKQLEAQSLIDPCVSAGGESPDDTASPLSSSSPSSSPASCQLQAGTTPISSSSSCGNDFVSKSLTTASTPSNQSTNTKGESSASTQTSELKGKWGAMPLKHRILKSFGMPTKEENKPPVAQNTGAGKTALPPSDVAFQSDARDTSVQMRQIEEERLGKIEAGIARARERGQVMKEREEADRFIQGPHRSGATKRRFSESDSSRPAGHQKDNPIFQGKRPRKGSSSGNDDSDSDDSYLETEPPTGVKTKRKAATVNYGPKKESPTMETDAGMSMDEQDEEKIQRRMKEIITHYDTMKDKNTAVAFLLNVIRNSNR